MARAIIGTGRGFGSVPKIKLDGDCGSHKKQACSSSSGSGGSGDGELGAFPVLQVVLRQRVGYDDDGVPQFDWAALDEGSAFVYEERTEWDAEAGVTVVKAHIVLPNLSGMKMVPETAVVREKSTGVLWEIKASKVTPDRIELQGYRVWYETISAVDSEEDWLVLDGGGVEGTGDVYDGGGEVAEFGWLVLDGGGA